MVYLLLMDGFEEIEALATVDVLRRGGVEVCTAGLGGKVLTGAHDITVHADITLEEINKDDMSMLILPGGAGHVNLDNSPEVHSLIDFAAQKDIHIAAICASPSILGKKGLLKGHKAVCFPGFEKFLDGAEVLSERTAVSGRFITANGAGSAIAFAYELLKILKGEETARNVVSSMRY
ncbi:MAG: DJ-1/PfpI family protein [Oscillospiraceae bacterium]|nr:DJ-1/PfpI family protein [Oscillospiraceae bacterium]